MRKIKTGFFLAVFATAAVLTGFAMPKLTADYQESHKLSQIDVYTSEDAHFPTTYHVLDCMKLMTYGYEEVDLESGKVHSQEEVSEICQNLLLYLSENHFIPEDSQVNSENKRVFLAIKKDKSTQSDSSGSENNEKFNSEKAENSRYSNVMESYASDVISAWEYSNNERNTSGTSDGNTQTAANSNSAIDKNLKVKNSDIDDISDMGFENEPQTISAIIWECILQDQYGNEVTLWIDDLSGKMISFQCTYNPDEILRMGYKNLWDYMCHENIYFTNMESFFENYYGFTEVFEECIYEIDGYPGRILLVFTDKSEEQAAVFMSIANDSDTIFFNPQ